MNKILTITMLMAMFGMGSVAYGQQERNQTLDSQIQKASNEDNSKIDSNGMYFTWRNGLLVYDTEPNILYTHKEITLGKTINGNSRELLSALQHYIQESDVLAYGLPKNTMVTGFQRDFMHDGQWITKEVFNDMFPGGATLSEIIIKYGSEGIEKGLPIYRLDRGSIVYVTGGKGNLEEELR